MKRPWSVTVISLVFVLAGAAGIVYHFSELTEIFRAWDVVLVFVVRLLAIVGGVFAWRGANWARFLLVAWIGYHVYLSIFHTTEGLIMHSIMMLLTVLALFHRKANDFFKK
jgi:hypothetical protein